MEEKIYTIKQININWNYVINEVKNQIDIEKESLISIARYFNNEILKQIESMLLSESFSL